MRRQLYQSVLELLRMDERVVVLLGDVGTFGMRDCFREFPGRIHNVGILEQAMAGMAAGMAMSGMIPIVHSFTPFLIERSLEQIKVDFGYQGLPGIFISIGGSYDYMAFGCTHHAPGDVQVMTSIPGIGVIVPGTGGEFDALLKASYNNGRAQYYRLSEASNRMPQPVQPGKGVVVKQGSRVTIVAVGPMLQPVLDAAEDLDVSIVYYTTVTPFDGAALAALPSSSTILLCEPYYRGGLSTAITEAMWPRPVALKCVGVPLKFAEHYGKREQQDEAFGLGQSHIRAHVEALLAA